MRELALLLALLAQGPSAPGVVDPRARIAELDRTVARELDAGRSGLAIRALRELEELHLGLGEPLEAAAALGRIGECHLAESCFPEAAQAYEARLAMLRGALRGADHPELARALNDLGFLRQRVGNRVEALALFEAALAMHQRLAPGDDPNVSITLSNIALCLSALGRGEEALPRMEEALAMSVRLHGEDSAAAAFAESNLGVCLQNLGRPEEALARFERALEILRGRGLGEEAEVARALGNLASCFDANGRAEEAVALHEEALALRRRLHAGDHPELVTSLTNLAGSLDVLGRGPEALERFQEALAMARRLYGEDHPEVALGLGNVGASLLRLGRTVEALFPLEAALAMWRRMQRGDDLGLASSLEALGICLVALGEGEAALPALEEALAVRRRLHPGDHPEVAASSARLARALLELGRAAEALPRFEAALAMRQRLRPGDSFEVAQSLNDFASCLDALGAVDQALAAYESALAMWRRLAEEERPRSVGALIGAASCLGCLGRGKEALATYGEALAVLRRGGESGAPSFASDLARLLVDDLGRPAEALAVLDEAIGELEQWSEAGAVNGDLDAAFGARSFGRWRAFDTMVRAQVALGRDSEALAYVERARVLSLLDLLAGPELDPLDEVERAARERGDEALAEEVASLRLDVAAVERDLSLLGRARLSAAGRGAMRGEGSAELERLDRELSIARACRRDVLERRTRLARPGLGWSAPVEPERLQALLEPGEFVLDYALSDEQSFAFLVPPTGGAIQSFALLWPDGRPLRRDELDVAIGEYLKCLGMSSLLRSTFTEEAPHTPGSAPAQAGAPGRAYSELGHRLFRALMPESLWQRLRGARAVRVLPAGALQRLPLEALVVEPGRSLESSVYWIDAGPALSYLPSASVLLWCRQRERVGPGELLVAVGESPLEALLAPARHEGAAGPAETLDRVLAGIDPFEERGSAWRRAKAELDALVERAKREPTFPLVVLRADEASASRLLELAPRTRFLHLATPGASYDAAAGASALAIPEGAAPHSLLGPAALFGPWRGKLSGCELVVLSGTRVEAGGPAEYDALFTLPLAFLRAGAGAVIAPLWLPVEPRASEIWCELFSSLSKDRTPSTRPSLLESFKAARRSLKRADPRPHAWAPFVLLGDSR